MSRLLRASFARLKKDKTFWICMAVMFGIGALFVISNYVTMKFRGYGATVDDALFSYGTYIGMFLAAFSSLYIGKEYSDGFGLAFFTEFAAPLGNAGFRYAVFRNNAFVGASLLQMKTDNFFLKFRCVTLWHNKYLFPLQF